MTISLKFLKIWYSYSQPEFGFLTFQRKFINNDKGNIKTFIQRLFKDGI